jgi:DNA-binding transcriptional ArsR family regulator
MPTSNFDIYEVGDDYVAVTNEVRRSILSTLEEGPSQLPDLVELTGKSKSTLSSIHVRELVDQGIVEAGAHPQDERKKVYQLAGRKIGSSDVPLEELREAVKEYVSLAPEAARFPLSVAIDAMAAVPEDADEDLLRSQARRLGLLVGQLLDVGQGRDQLMDIADMLEREGLADPVRLDMEAGDRLVLRPGDSAPREASLARTGVLVAGLVEGVLATDGAPEVEVSVVSDERFALAIT